jgi:hypothetical protein
VSFALLLALGACGNLQERDLCRQYDDLQATVAQVQELDPATATTDDVRDIADETLASLDQLLAASDGLYDFAISTFRLAVTELRQAAVALPGTTLDVARPLMAESRADAITAYELLQQRLDVVCTTG